jgi:hypothetical protein
MWRAHADETSSRTSRKCARSQAAARAGEELRRESTFELSRARS